MSYAPQNFVPVGIVHASNQSDTTIPLVLSRFKYQTIANKTNHSSQFQEFRLKKYVLVWNDPHPPLYVILDPNRERRKGKKLREDLPCHCFGSSKIGRRLLSNSKLICIYPTYLLHMSSSSKIGERSLSPVGAILSHLSFSSHEFAVWVFFLEFDSLSLPSLPWIKQWWKDYSIFDL